MNEDSQEVTSEEMQSAYENFIVELTSLSQSDKDYQLIYQNLGLDSYRVPIITTTNFVRAGKKCLKNLYLQKSISIFYN